MFDFIIYGFESAIILELLKIIYLPCKDMLGLDSKWENSLED